MMLEKMIDGLAAGGPMYLLFAGMLWLWVKQSEKHEQHWMRMMVENMVVQEKRATSDLELAKVLSKMELIMERVLDGMEAPAPHCEDLEQSKSKRRN